MTDQADIRQDPAFREMEAGIARERALITGRSKVPFLKRWLNHIGCKTLTEAKVLRQASLRDHVIPVDLEEQKLQELLPILEKDGISRKGIERHFNTIHSFYYHNGVPLTDQLPSKYKASA